MKEKRAWGGTSNNLDGLINLLRPDTQNPIHRYVPTNWKKKNEMKRRNKQVLN